MSATAARFEKFHAENPLVYDTLVRLAKEWVSDHGRQRLGIRMLWEASRWEIIKATRDVDFKLNNNYTPYYVRMIQLREPELDGLFEVRDSPADDWARAKILAGEL